MKRSLCMAGAALLLLAACEETTPTEREPAPIEGLWKVVEVVGYRYNDGATNRIDLRNLAGPLTFSFKDGVYESQGSLSTRLEWVEGSQVGTYVVIKETQTIVVTAQDATNPSSSWTAMYAYQMSGDDDAATLLNKLAGGTHTWHLERMPGS